MASSPNEASSSSHVGKTLVLKSPMGADSITYKWPLKKGKGSVRRSEDKEDEAAEILETIRFVCYDIPDIQQMMDDEGTFRKYDETSFEAMEAFCNGYNNAVDSYLAKQKKTDTAKPQELPKTRCSRPHLKHILQKCYNKSVTDPNLLNHYEAFTPEVYGETSFELICQIIDKLQPISSDNKFVDLGSGVGQVVLQMAALTDCEISIGIEKANTPAMYAKELERWFKFWMAFYGKTFSKFTLNHGDFLDKQHRADILQSTIVFVNNFAFGPELDQHLKDIFADLNDGARIFSSKSFCAINFRITDRNLSDIGTIMHVSQMDPLKGSVSWTGKSVSYYLHVIDRARLERYFQKSKSAARNHEPRRRHRGNGETEDSSIDASLDNSRASSVEGDLMSFSENSNSKKPWSDDEDSGDRPKRRGRRARANGPRRQHPTVIRLSKQNSTESNEPIVMAASDPTDSNSSTPPAVVAAAPTSERPIRTAAANATAISEAQTDNKVNGGNKNKNMLGRKKKSGPIASRISGLDLLYDTTMDCIEASNKDVTAPMGCVNERLNRDHPKELVHEELSTSLIAGEDGKPIPFQLQVHLDRLKRELMSFIRHMMDPTFKDRVKASIAFEESKKAKDIKTVKHLKAQIDNLVSDTCNILKGRLNELGIQANTPTEFIEQAKAIVVQHHELQRRKVEMEKELRPLELEQEKIILTKEKQMLDFCMKKGMTMSEARRRVKVAIENAINGIEGSEIKGSPLLNKLADVTLTKCEQLPSSTQIRKRPATVAKQRDWPEKKVNVGGNNAQNASEWSTEIAKIEEKNPEVLARKIIEQGRNLEKSKSAAAMLLSPRTKDPLIQRGSVEVEVRRIEQKHDLPRIDMASSFAAVRAPPEHHHHHHRDQGELVLPPHPRSRSSDQTDEVTPAFQSNKMTSTPRAEQFEDRLKTIINSVLSGEEKTNTINTATASSSSMDVKPPISMMPNSKPMFSPVKKELPTHLPLPPAGIAGDPYGKMRPGLHHGLAPHQVSLPQMGSARTMNDIIEKEIERNLSMDRARMSPQKLVRPGHNAMPPQQTPSSSTGMARMSQVIEDSLRGHVPRPSELEGLACPRTKSPPPQPQPSSVPQRPVVPQGFRINGGDGIHEYPAMEGLGARFSSYLEKRDMMANKPQGQPPQPVQPTSTPSSNSWGSHHDQGGHGVPPNSAYRYPHYGPPPVSSSSSGYVNSSVPPRKRSSPSSGSMPVQLPPKKQHIEAGVDYSFQKDDDSGRKWQDEINSGFDRLVAYATEVDKRRKSTDSNSPVRSNSGLSHEELALSRSSAEVDDVFAPAVMKFKANTSSHSGPRGVVSANSPYARAMPVHSGAKSHVPSALASVASLEDLQNPRSPLPGENLPEHHFKKRYFAETRGESTTPNSTSSRTMLKSPASSQHS